MFNLAGSILAALLRMLNKLLYCSLHRPEHQRRASKAYHLQGAYRLMQLLACNTQLAGIQRGQVRAFRGLSVSHETL